MWRWKRAFLRLEQISSARNKAISFAEGTVPAKFDLGLCDDARSRPVVRLLQEVIRVLQGLIVAQERRIA